jgi:hypothetical protein
LLKLKGKAPESLRGLRTIPIYLGHNPGTLRFSVPDPEVVTDIFVEQIPDFFLAFLFLRQGDLVVRNAGAAQERNTRNATLAGRNS